MEVLGLFAKHWAPGEVKTRIAAKTGPDLAARLAHRLLESVAEEFQAVAEQRWNTRVQVAQVVLALWFGVSKNELPTIFPGIKNFYSLSNPNLPLGFMKM